MSNLRTHPQPLLLKREGAKTSSFPSFLKVPPRLGRSVDFVSETSEVGQILVREGFRVCFLILTQSVKGVASHNRFCVT